MLKLFFMLICSSLQALDYSFEVSYKVPGQDNSRRAEILNLNHQPGSDERIHAITLMHAICHKLRKELGTATAINMTQFVLDCSDWQDCSIAFLNLIELYLISIDAYGSDDVKSRSQGVVNYVLGITRLPTMQVEHEVVTAKLDKWVQAKSQISVVSGTDEQILDDGIFWQVYKRTELNDMKLMLYVFGQLELVSIPIWHSYLKRGLLSDEDDTKRQFLERTTHQCLEHKGQIMIALQAGDIANYAQFKDALFQMCLRLAEVGYQISCDVSNGVCFSQDMFHKMPLALSNGAAKMTELRVNQFFHPR